jgi:signal transduction histidine kinase/CheY-like chemotaxis protein
VKAWRAMSSTIGLSLLSLLYVAVPTSVLATVLGLLLRSARRMGWPFGKLWMVPLDRLDQQLDVYVFVFWTCLNLNALVMTTFTIAFTWPNSQRYVLLNGALIGGKRLSCAFFKNFIFTVYVTGLWLFRAGKCSQLNAGRLISLAHFIFMVVGSAVSGEDASAVMLKEYGLPSIFMLFGVLSNVEWAMFLCSLLGCFFVVARTGLLSVQRPWFDYKSMSADSTYLPVTMAVGNLLFLTAIRIVALYKSARIAKHFATEDTARTEFLQSVTHEIKSPLNGILGCVELMSGSVDNLTLDQQEQLEVISHSGAVLSLLVDNVLSKERTSLLSESVVVVRRDLRLFFEDVFRVLRKLVYKPNMEFVLELDKRLPITAVIPASMLTQILLNLGMNAMKHASQGREVCFAVQFESETKTLVCEIRDRGPGIKNEEALFERSKVMMASTSGTGLGLHVCRILCKAIGAIIGYRPNGHRGSVFFVRLQVDSDERYCGTWEDDSQEPIRRNSGMVQVTALGGLGPDECGALVVDDSKVNVKVLTGLLTKRLEVPLKVIGEAEDGVEALKYLLNRGVCETVRLIVFMDIQMPRMDGNKCAKCWRELEKTLNLKPAFLVAVSAGHEATTPDFFDAVLPKPIQLFGLKGVVDKWIPIIGRTTPLRGASEETE